MMTAIRRPFNVVPPNICFAKYAENGMIAISFALLGRRRSARPPLSVKLDRFLELA